MNDDHDSYGILILIASVLLVDYVLWRSIT